MKHLKLFEGSTNIIKNTDPMFYDLGSLGAKVKIHGPFLKKDHSGLPGIKSNFLSNFPNVNEYYSISIFEAIYSDKLELHLEFVSEVLELVERLRDFGEVDHRIASETTYENDEKDYDIGIYYSIRLFIPRK